MKHVYHLFKSIIIFILVGITAITGDPQFAESIRNVTVTLGREATLSCVIDNLAEYKVGWLRAEDQTILSLQSSPSCRDA
uniref:Ig-like domain-containing protein n=1 Tax=Daphnia galeata TaxID=27404 RepID=A0A8J2RJY4_9CRUS|nr:unnamed protein product [Daphnia galeata]